MKEKIYLKICILLMIFATSNCFAVEKQKKVLYVGIDGLIWRAITQENAPNLKKLMDESWTSTNAIAEIPTYSANGWAALLTGVSVKKHKCIINEFVGNDLATYPSIFSLLRTNYPAMRTTSFTTWSPINDNIVKYLATITQNSSGVGTPADKDQSIADKVIAEINREQTADITFLQFDHVDGAGHNNTYSPNNAVYVAAVKRVDKHVGDFLSAIKARPDYANEDWLVAVVTDHGAVGNNHGGSSYEEQNAFIILNNPAITPKLINDLPVLASENIKTVDFNSNVYGTLPSDLLDFGADKSFTIELRTKSITNVGDPCLISNKDWKNGKNPGVLICNNAGTFKINIADNNGIRADIPGKNMKDGLWHHISMVVNRSTQRLELYEGGYLLKWIDISNIGDLTPAAGLAMNIAQDGTGGYKYAHNGYIAEVRIFKSAVSSETVKDYAFKTMDNQHPDYANLVLYTPGNDGSGNKYTGKFEKPGIDIKTKNEATIGWSDVNSPILGNISNFGNAPFLYDVVPTLFSFMKLPIKSEYKWDGRSLIDFNGTDIKKVQVNTKSEIQVRSEGNNIIVQFNPISPTANHQVRVYNLNGEVLAQKAVPVMQNDRIQTMVEVPEGGMLIISVSANNKQLSTKYYK